MKKWSVFVLFIVLLTGCRSTPFSPEISIDWVDFVKWDGKSYDGIPSINKVKLPSVGSPSSPTDG
ncbi:hypothetical protein JK635_01040 [Neobacillus sp. YIM B02564]|uniref:Lipoprotein n=1 Tax=Neobacillus paridis TaxID=2803862 RepID=A0ABS1THN3_9BACI|nr:hypothetical protein [Neobacillus paridis]MBL4950829.1 hypothetical protein [Neobacillus paridis]